MPITCLHSHLQCTVIGADNIPQFPLQSTVQFCCRAALGELGHPDEGEVGIQSELHFTCLQASGSHAQGLGLQGGKPSPTSVSLSASKQVRKEGKSVLSLPEQGEIK